MDSKSFVKLHDSREGGDGGPSKITNFTICCIDSLYSSAGIFCLWMLGLLAVVLSITSLAISVSTSNSRVWLFDDKTSTIHPNGDQIKGVNLGSQQKLYIHDHLVVDHNTEVNSLSFGDLQSSTYGTTVQAFDHIELQTDPTGHGISALSPFLTLRGLFLPLFDEFLVNNGSTRETQWGEGSRRILKYPRVNQFTVDKKWAPLFGYKEDETINGFRVEQFVTNPLDPLSPEKELHNAEILHFQSNTLNTLKSYRASALLPDLVASIQDILILTMTNHVLALLQSLQEPPDLVNDCFTTALLVTKKDFPYETIQKCICDAWSVTVVKLKKRKFSGAYSSSIFFVQKLCES